MRPHRDVTRAEARGLVAEMLGMVGFPHPAKALDSYPFALSGGASAR